MNILILSDYFSTEGVGGAGVVAVDEAVALKKRGHEVSVITITNDVNDEGQSEWNGLTIYRLYSNYNPIWRAYLSLHNYAIVPKISEIIRKVKPDVVHAHNIHTYISYRALKLAKRSGAKVFITLHDVMAVHYGKFVDFIDPSNLAVPQTFNFKISPWKLLLTFRKRFNPFRNVIIRHYLSYANMIFAVSDILKQVLETNGIRNVEVVHNAIDLESWNIPDSESDHFKETYGFKGKKVLFFSGWSTGAKGGDQLLAAFKVVSEHHPDAVILALGKTDGYYRDMLHVADQLKVSAEKIIMPGLLGGQALKIAYISSDVVVFPSVCFETFGMVSLEGMAAKKPVIASCFGGSREVVVDGVTGYVVNPYDAATMAADIIRLLDDPELARKFGTAGYERARADFNMTDKISQLESWYMRA